ncbi:hypothetical protein [Methylobacterium sp. E-066]|uniref:hypothetical protein n=1 Tax=Methylobacterium sp. E-066 TaxID=2836584 RepID=UPI001FBC01A4|nr:hypothetical protein [Methylobacterium sp. E-066]MCJ2143678.1 hypothetical protein [Methylobacterium sp. E-066]
MPGRRFTPEQHEQMAEMREKGRTYGQIALAFGCSESTAYWTCLRLGADRPGSRPLQSHAAGPEVVLRNGRPVRRYSAEEDAQLLALAEEGRGDSEIGHIIGRRPNSVRARLATLARHEARSEAA